jgi:hypothetical protein
MSILSPETLTRLTTDEKEELRAELKKIAQETYAHKQELVNEAFEALRRSNKVLVEAKIETKEIQLLIASNTAILGKIGLLTDTRKS